MISPQLPCNTGLDHAFDIEAEDIPADLRFIAAARRSVAQLARAPVSKTGGWGFESLHSCQRQRSVVGNQRLEVPSARPRVPFAV